VQFGIDGIEPDLASLPLRIQDGEDEAHDGAIEVDDVHFPVRVPRRNPAERSRVLLLPVIVLELEDPAPQGLLEATVDRLECGDADFQNPRVICFLVRPHRASLAFPEFHTDTPTS